MKRSEFKSWFDTFYDKTYAGAMAYCLAKTGDFINSEDLLADAYFSLYKRVSKTKAPVSDPQAYLFKILKNRIAKYWMKHSKEKELFISENDATQYESLLELELDLTAETATKQMLLQDIMEYISTCTPMMRRAFTLHFILERSIEDTAKELGVSVAAARNYIYRTLQSVRENFLEDYE